jgi:hypothetical protein
MAFRFKFGSITIEYMDQKLAAYTRSQWKIFNLQTDGYCLPPSCA